MTTPALKLINDRGFAIRVIDRQFHVVATADAPSHVVDKPILEAVNKLKEQLIDALYLMDEIKEWAGDDQKKWGALLDIAHRNYQAAWEITPGGVLLTWVGNRYRYSRGLKENNEADISFFSRVVHGLEPRVPEALAAVGTMADIFRRKVRA